MLNFISKKGSHDSDPNANQHASPIDKETSLLSDKIKNSFEIVEAQCAAVVIRCACFSILV